MQATALLDRHQYLSLATYRSTGAEVRTPVWFAAVDDALMIVSSGDAGKVKRLRRSSAARVAPCDVRGSIEGPWQDATARIVTDPDAIARAHRALRRKYRWKMRMLDLISRLGGRIKNRAWIEIALRA